MTLRWSSDGHLVVDVVVGSKVAGYQIEGLIGRGGMGEVYRAQDLRLGRTVALKVIAPESAEDRLFRERFLHESRVAASLDHPHVVPIFNAGEDEGALFLAMRYIEGTDLGKLLAAEGALEPSRAVALLEQVAEALDAAHRQGLVHRDVKPSNVLIASAAGQEDCYLADFGLTKRTGSLSGVSAPGDVVGTLEYIAPEQITGDEVDARADLYSLGCVLYECLTGTAPFPRATHVALLWAHVHEEPAPPSQARLELPRALDTMFARALAKDPSRRYASAGELVAAARSALGLVATPVPAAAASLGDTSGSMTGRGTPAGDGAGRRIRYHLLTTDGGIVADQPGKMAGEAAIGVVLKAPLEEISEPIGPAKDHHVAEYRALIRGLEAARSRGIGHLRVCLDSALLVNQLNGKWKVKAEHLKPFHERAVSLIQQFADITITWMPRKANAEADALASTPLGPLRAKPKPSIDDVPLE